MLEFRSSGPIFNSMRSRVLGGFIYPKPFVFTFKKVLGNLLLNLAGSHLEPIIVNRAKALESGAIFSRSV